MRKRGVGFGAFICCAVLLSAALWRNDAYAVIEPNWKPLPLACLPDRAQRWDAGKAETAQAACHCPDTTLAAYRCPSRNGFSTLPPFLAATNLPNDMTLRCCDMPICPGGTDLSGQVMPSDGNCDLEVCPWDTQRGGQALPAIPIVIPAPGDPLPVPPTLEERIAAFCGGQVRERGENPADGPPGRDCISGDTLVTKADGTSTSVASLKVGDEIVGLEGNVIVSMVNRLQQAAPLLYSINGGLKITGEHPILTTKGWKEIDPEVDEKGQLAPRLEVGDMLKTADEPVEVKSIEVVKDGKDEATFNLNTRDDKAFVADGVVIKPFKDVRFDY